MIYLMQNCRKFTQLIEEECISTSIKNTIEALFNHLQEGGKETKIEEMFEYLKNFLVQKPEEATKVVNELKLEKYILKQSHYQKIKKDKTYKKTISTILLLSTFAQSGLKNSCADHVKLIQLLFQCFELGSQD